MRISDWSSDVCSSDLGIDVEHPKDLDRLVPSKQSVVFVPDAEAIEIGAQRILVRGGIWDGVNCIHALARDSPIYGDLLRCVRMIGFDPWALRLRPSIGRARVGILARQRAACAVQFRRRNNDTPFLALSREAARRVEKLWV